MKTLNARILYIKSLDLLVCFMKLKKPSGRRNLHNGIKTFISLSISHFITFPVLSFLLLLNYMRDKSSFDFDMVGELYSANRIFVMTEISTLIFISMSFFGVIFIIKLPKKIKKEQKIGLESTFIISVVNLFMLFLFIVSSFNALKSMGFEQIKQSLQVVAMMIGIVIYLTSLLRTTLKTKLIYQLAIVMAVGLFCIFPNQFLSRLYGKGLAEFNVGGEILASVMHEKNYYSEEILIVLQTPNMLHYKKIQKNDQPSSPKETYGVIPLSRIYKIEYINK